jgi:hypothetical protein
MPEENSPTIDSSTRANIRRDGEPPSVEELARRAGKSEIEILRIQFEDFVALKRAEEIRTLEQRRTDAIKEKRRLHARILVCDEEIARAEQDLARLDPGWKSRKQLKT